MQDLPLGRFAFYQEELDELFGLSRQFFKELRAKGKSRVNSEILKRQSPSLVGEKGGSFDLEDVLAAGNYLGLIRVDPEADGWIEIV